MSERRHPNLINVDEIEPMQQERGKFACTARRLADHTGAAQVGCSYYEVPPGKTAFPAHYHCSTEEAIFVIEGAGELRIGEQRVAVRPGDFVTLPVGPDHAHQLFNAGDEMVRYLCMSSMQAADVVGYPDSGKIGAIGGPPSGEPWIARWFRAGDNVDYFDGEE